MQVNPIFVLRLFGQLGNQMFQYAAAKTAAAEAGAILVLSTTELLDTKIDRVYNSFLLPERSWLNRCAGNSVYRLRHRVLKDILKEENILDTDTVARNSLIKGYFQSACYFESQRDLVLQSFQLATVHRKVVDQHLNSTADFGATRCALHVRRGDYLNFSGHGLPAGAWILPSEYYEQALEQIPSSCEVVIFGDDPEWADQQWGNRPGFSIAQRNHPAVDMMLMASFQYMITSNSTYSWWTGHLNNRPDRKIYAPMYHLGWSVQKWFPNVKIINDDWVYIAVNDSDC